MSIYDYRVRAIDGTETALADYRGLVLLIVNTASRCGFTPQFDGLETLYKKYKDQGLRVLGFPSNQFGAQDPGENSEIESFCRLNYGVTFPMMAKIDVNGEAADPLYVYLKGEQGGLLGSDIKWNFTKFLVDRAGRVIRRYAPSTAPAALENDIRAALASG